MRQYPDHKFLNPPFSSDTRGGKEREQIKCALNCEYLESQYFAELCPRQTFLFLLYRPGRSKSFNPILPDLRTGTLTFPPALSIKDGLPTDPLLNPSEFLILLHPTERRSRERGRDRAIGELFCPDDAGGKKVLERGDRTVFFWPTTWAEERSADKRKRQINLLRSSFDPSKEISLISEFLKKDIRDGDVERMRDGDVPLNFYPVILKSKEVSCRRAGCFVVGGKRGIDVTSESELGDPPGVAGAGDSFPCSCHTRGGRRIFYLTNLSPCVIRGSTWHELTG